MTIQVEDENNSWMGKKVFSSLLKASIYPNFPIIVMKQALLNSRTYQNTLDTILIEKASNDFIGLVLVYASNCFHQKLFIADVNILLL